VTAEAPLLLIGSSIYNGGTIFHMLPTEAASNACAPKVKQSRAHSGGEVVSEPAATAVYNRSKSGLDRVTRSLNTLQLFRPEHKWTMHAL